MKLASTRGTMVVDEKKFAYMVVYESWNPYKGEYHTQVTKRTNDIKAAEKELKRIQKRHADDIADGFYSRNGWGEPKGERIINC